MKPVLFIDFDGTLCHQRYWRSLPAREHEMVQELLFRSDRALVDDWMRGRYSAEEINAIVAAHIGMDAGELWKLFVQDCETMTIDPQTLARIDALRASYRVILMTTNMDSFTRFTVPALHLETYFDAISNSYYEGKKKTDDGGSVFVAYADRSGVPIGRCILIDDQERVCAVFRSLGGTAYRVTRENGIDSYLDLLQ